MQIFDNGPIPSQPPASFQGETGYRLPRRIRRDGASLRMVAAMADPFTAAARSLFEGEFVETPLTPFAPEARESDALYHGRRSKEEIRAAGEAAVPEARAAHQELADLHARLSRRARRRSHSANGRPARLSGRVTF